MGSRKMAAEKRITRKRRFEKTNPSGAVRRRAGENGTGEQVKTKTSRCGEPHVQITRLHLRSPDLLFT
jgi:hypothetical protein